MIILLFAFQSCQVGRMIIYNLADIKDYKKFPYREIETDSTKFIFQNAINPKIPKAFTTADSITFSFEEFLKKNKTVAFLIIRNDSIYYKNYFKGYSEKSVVPSFSMAKSVISILIGAAIEDGYIASVNDPVTKYVPEMKNEGFDKISIENLLQMTSGIAFSESYLNPFGDAAAFYYGKNLKKKTYRLDIETAPGTHFDYSSGSAQLLGTVLNNALPNGITISNYLEKRLWKPMGMKYKATWSLDEKNGIEKTFCCLNASAIDYAKIGRLYLHNGNWDGKQIIPKAWVQKSTEIDTTNGSAKFYQYQWWLPKESGDFAAKGILGQFIYVNPKKNLIIVRLGKNYGDVEWMDVFNSLSQHY